ncbi:MAG: MFS transporter, partial [Dehalococcoidia bacterium]
LAVVWPSMYAIVGRRFKSSLQGRLFAIISIGQIAGTVIGAGTGAALIDQFSYPAAFIEAVGLMAGAIVLGFVVIPGGVAGRAQDAAGDADDMLAGFRSVGRLISAPIVLLAILIAVMSFGVSMLTPDLKPYGTQTLGLKYSTFLALLVLPGAAAGLLLVPAGYVADRFGRSLPLTVGLIVFPTSLAILTLTRTPVVAMLIATAAAIGYVLCLPALSATMLDLTTAETRGAVTGFTTSVQAIGGVIGPPVGGALVDSLGPLAPFRAAAGLLFLALALSLGYRALTRGLYNTREHRDETRGSA